MKIIILFTLFLVGCSSAKKSEQKKAVDSKGVPLAFSAEIPSSNLVSWKKVYEIRYFDRAEEFFTSNKIVKVCDYYNSYQVVDKRISVQPTEIRTISSKGQNRPFKKFKLFSKGVKGYVNIVYPSKRIIASEQTLDKNWGRIYMFHNKQKLQLSAFSEVGIFLSNDKSLVELVPVNENCSLQKVF